MTKINFKFAALALAAPGLALAMPAQAAAPASAYQGVYAPTYEVESANQWRDRDRYDRYDRGRYDRDRYDRHDRYDRRVWRGRDGRTYCERDDGTTGLLIGGAVGGLLGHEIAGRGDRTLGAILGAAGGALLGREIDKGSTRCR
jgi:hypothetical protein